ncbi:MAG: T9SS type B sorting domain-containing protein, partial [Flavobacterium sp.]
MRTDNDGISCNFDLTTKINEITGGNPGIQVAFYETPTSGSAIPTGVPYCNISHFNQTIYVRAFDPAAPACYSTTSFQLIVNPVPIPNASIADYELCDYNAPANSEVFDLGSMIPQITSLSGVTIRFYDNLTDAQNPATSTALPNFYASNPATNPQQIWFNIMDNVTGCNTTGSFNLVVNPLPLAVTPPTIFECSNGAVLTAIFDLTINEGAATGGVPGMSVSYYNSLADAQGGNPGLAIGSPTTYFGTDNETVYLRVEDNATGCYSTTTQLLRVTQGPVAVTPQPLQYCDPNNDGFGEFNLNDATNAIAGGSVPAGVSVSYHETPDDAFIGANPIPLSTLYSNITPWSQILYVRVYYTLTGCANYVQLKLNVNRTPEATDPTPYALCDATGVANTESFDLTTKIAEILGSISPATVSVRFYESLADAQAPTGNIVGVTNYVSGTRTLYVRVEFTATGCYDIVELHLVVNPLPNSLQPNYPQYSLCDVNQSAGDIGYEVFNLSDKIDDILLGQSGMEVTFYTSLGDAQNGTASENINLLFPSLQYRNRDQYVQTLGIRITNVATGCYVVSTMDIRVEPLPTLIPPTQPFVLCDANQDGYTEFDLTTLLPSLLGPIPPNYTVSFHETYDDADANGTTIPDPVHYQNLYAFVQTIYVRAEDNTTHCVSILPIQLNVDPSPIEPINLNDIVVCDQDTAPQDSYTFVDLTQRTADVLAQQPLAASSYIVTYHVLQSDALQGTPLIVQSGHYYGFNTQQIWVRVENATTHCFNIGSFHLVINAPLALTTPAPLSLCDDDATPNDQHHVFDLTVKDNEINLGTGYQVTYYPSLAQAGVAGAEITLPTAYPIAGTGGVQTLGVMVTTPQGCKSFTTLDIRVLPIPTPRTNPPALAPKCDDNSPGNMTEEFNLTVNEGYIRNNDPMLSFHYYYSQADALVPQNEIGDPVHAEVGGNVWIRVENTRVDYQGNHCYVLVEQALRVNPLPQVIQPLAAYRMCDDDADGIAQFDLTNPLLAPQILGTATTGQQPSDFTISYYLTAAGANPATNTGESPLPSPYTNTGSPNTQVVYIRVVNNATGCVNPAGTLTLAVEAYATATGPQHFDDCDNYNDPYDGVHQVDLTQFATAILNGQNPSVFLVSYYTSQADAIAGTGALTPAQAQAYQTDPDTDTIWVKVENSSNSITPVCYAITTIEIHVERYPNPIISTPNGVTTICVDFITDAVVRPLTLSSGIANPANYTFEWFEASAPTTVIGTGPSYTVASSAPGGATRTYTVHVTSTSALGCDTTSASFDVIQSGQAVIPAGTAGYTVTNAFSTSQIITVTVDGYGSYEYSLDDGPRQASNVFENVSLGTHVIHVWDTEGGVAYSCEELIITDVSVIDYPHYFTPNGDGIHDTWNIVGLGGQPNAKIYIFDRYGKLMKQISSQGQGWDGTFNGHVLPADDYW